MTELFEQFQQFRKILCICPCCGDIIRVSDLRLRVKGPAIRTWLDDYEQEERELVKREEKLGEKEEELREIAREKGRKEAERMFNRVICPAFRALKIDPFDVKPLLNPVDFLVFRGMNKEESINDIILLSKHIDCRPLNTNRGQIRLAVSKGKYAWQIANIDEKGKIIFK